MKSVSIVLLVIALAACATAIPPSQGIYSGNAAYERGDYEQARTDFTSALQVANKQGWKPHIATAKYGLGRSLGQLCDFEAAERNLKEAVALEEELTGANSVNLAQDQFELARLYYDYGQYSKAVPHFRRAVNIADGLRVESSDPIGYANVLQDYAVSLEKSGDEAGANTVKTRIVTLEQKNLGKRAGFHITRFKPACMPNNAVNMDAQKATLSGRPLP